MPKIEISNLIIEMNGSVATISGQFSNNSFAPQEVKQMMAAILQNLTEVGDMSGNPISSNVQINGTSISGQQRKI